MDQTRLIAARRVQIDARAGVLDGSPVRVDLNVARRLALQANVLGEEAGFLLDRRDLLLGMLELLDPCRTKV